jgi:nitrite reductase/ring-hydroxylating ferredoxin subunit
MTNTKIALKKSDLVEKKPVGVNVNGKMIMLVLIEGQPYAIDGVCSHRGGPLEKGALNGYTVTCPWHRAQFDVRDGNVSPTTPWGKHQDTHPVTVDQNGEIWIDA